MRFVGRDKEYHQRLSTNGYGCQTNEPQEELNGRFWYLMNLQALSQIKNQSPQGIRAEPEAMGAVPEAGGAVQPIPPTVNGNSEINRYFLSGWI
ncbi:MAG: hypothetical protein J5802_03820 [Butyrivibrio sp.]|nr:hypothetical protein [Butyrivibrio sp.]